MTKSSTIFQIIIYYLFPTFIEFLGTEYWLSITHPFRNAYLEMEAVCFSQAR
jgi:hypothetical protein